MRDGTTGPTAVIETAAPSAYTGTEPRDEKSAEPSEVRVPSELLFAYVRWPGYLAVADTLAGATFAVFTNLPGHIVVVVRRPAGAAS